MINKNTQNKSFINMWRYLQTEEVENNIFMLTLNDESLRDFKLEDLCTNDKDKRSILFQKIHEECRQNIWFFFRELIKIPNPVAYHSHQNSICDSYYVLNPDEMKIIYAYEHDISILKKIDDVPKGIKTTIYLLELYHYLFRSDNEYGILSYSNYINFISSLNIILNTNMSSIPQFDLIDNLGKYITLPSENSNDIVLNSSHTDLSTIFIL